MSGKAIVSVTSTTIVLFVSFISWFATGKLAAYQWLALSICGMGTFWLILPVQIKHFFEQILADPRWCEIDWQDDWSDFLALSAMLLACLIATVPF